MLIFRKSFFFAINFEIVLPLKSLLLISIPIAILFFTPSIKIGFSILSFERRPGIFEINK